MSESPLKLQVDAKHWDIVPLKSASVFIKDGTHGTHERVQAGIPLLSAKNISPFGKITIDEDDSLISEDEYQKIHSKYKLTKGDLLLTVVGTLGRSALINSDKRFSIQRSIGVIRCSESKVVPEFLYQFTGTDYFQGQLVLRSNATAQAGIYLGELAKIEVPRPPLPEQQKIAAILSSVDDVIEKTRAQIDKLKDLKTGMMQELLTKGIGHTEFKDSLVGRIPVAWTVKNLSDLIHTMESGWSPQCESEPAKPGEWAVLKTTSVTWDGFDYTANKKLPNHLSPRSQIQVNEGDILITRAGPTERVGVVAYVDQVSDKIMLSDKLIRLKTRDNIDALYLTFYLSTEFTKDFLAKRMTGLAQSQTNISQEILKSIPCAVPPLSEQNLIRTFINEVNKRMRIYLNRLQKQQNIKKALMQDLLTGKVRVKVDQKESAVA